MIVTDILVLAALAAFVAAWWLRKLPRRPAVLLTAALVALAAGLTGAFDSRLQDAAGAAVALVCLLVLLINRLRRSAPRQGAPFVSGTLFALLGVAAAAAIWIFPIAPLPKPSGPYAVGVRTFELDDTARPGVFAAAAGEPRRLLVRIWYPAGDVRGRTPAPYLSAREASAAIHSRSATAGFPLKHIRTNSYADAPLRPGAKDLPVVFYSHGYTSFLAQNTVLMEHLASHGYVVVSVQHP